jgi:hypothetical protein
MTYKVRSALQMLGDSTSDEKNCLCVHERQKLVDIPRLGNQAGRAVQSEYQLSYL